MIGPEDDWDAAAEGKPAGEGAAVTGTKTVGGYDVRGQPATIRQEESDRYRGIIGAAMERAGWAMEAAKVGSGAILSRFFSMVGGVVSDDGTAPVANQSPVGTGQRGLLDGSGAWWFRLVESFENWISERNAIVGEDARGVPLQRLVVGKTVTYALDLASALTGSLFNIAYASLAVTQPMMIDRAKNQTFRVTYTPAVSGSRPLLYPMVSQGEVPEAFLFVPVEENGITPIAGPTNPPTYAHEPAGYLAKDPFVQHGTLTAASSYTAMFMLGKDERFPACTALRFAVRDTSSVTAGTVTITGTQE